MIHEQGFQFLGKLLHGSLIIRIADIKYLAVAYAVLVFDDLYKTCNPVIYIGEASFLGAAVNETDRLAQKEIADKLGNNPGASFLFRVCG